MAQRNLFEGSFSKPPNFTWWSVIWPQSRIVSPIEFWSTCTEVKGHLISPSISLWESTLISCLAPNLHLPERKFLETTTANEESPLFKSEVSSSPVSKSGWKAWPGRQRCTSSYLLLVAQLPESRCPNCPCSIFAVTCLFQSIWRDIPLPNSFQYVAELPAAWQLPESNNAMSPHPHIYGHCPW